MSMPIGRPRFVTVEQCIGWHEMAISEYGGLSGIRELPLLESALAMPRQGFGGQYAHDFPFGMAAAYAFHVAKNHPFADGNKRAALLCCGSFLRMNGWDLMSTGDQAADAILDLVEGRKDKAGFAAWLEANCRVRPSLELRDFFRDLDSGKHFQQIDAFSRAAVLVENAETIEEARMAIPLIAHLLDRAMSLETSGKQDAAQVFAAQALILVDVFRIAGDMGYEW